MQELSITAQLRQKTGGKGLLSSLRRDKKIPGVVYGGEKPPVTISVAEKDLQRLQKSGSNSIINLSAEDWTDKVIIKQIQGHVITLDPVHVDFLRISMKKKLEITVPIRLHGDSKVMKETGALMEHALRELDVRCLPADIPSEIAVDVANLVLNQAVTVADLQLPPGVESLGEPTTLVVHLVIPKEEVVEEAAAAEGGAAEPEVIAKGKKEEEGAEGAAPAAGKDGKAAAPAGKDAKAPAAKAAPAKPEKK
ncbi:MAG: 50S ribosomal protein L25 [Elusimicrobiales bacterium]